MDSPNQESAGLDAAPGIVHLDGVAQKVLVNGGVPQNAVPLSILELELQADSKDMETLAANEGGTDLQGTMEVPVSSKSKATEGSSTRASQHLDIEGDKQGLEQSKDCLSADEVVTDTKIDQIVTELQTELHDLEQADLLTVGETHLGIEDQPDEVLLEPESASTLEASEFEDLDLAVEKNERIKNGEPQTFVGASGLDDKQQVEPEFLPIALKELEPDVSKPKATETDTNAQLQVPVDVPTAPGLSENSQLAALEEAVDTGPIPFFVINSTGRKAASPRLSNETIDFGVSAARISADKFVGVRYVREGGELSQSGSASPGARLLGAIQELPAKTIAAAEKTVSSMLAVLPSPRKETAKTPNGSAQPSRRNSGAQDAEAPHASGHHNEAEQDQPNPPASSERRASTDSPELHVWEIIWKDHSKHTQDRPGGPLQQIQFETTKAGFRFIQRIIDVWSLEATDSSAMTEAARALLKAQDALHEVQPDYPFQKPETSDNFPRSLFGKARANGKAESALPRTVSEDLRSETSAIDRTESGVSAAESVESVSSVRSSASGGHVAIALVASGSTNKYGGGLQHVMIPETEATPPPEKPGAPLVEGRFLPNMSPHSHIMQQPHIRALAAALPVRFRLSPWVLLYSTWRDGISLQTLYRKATKKGPSILVILDQKHNVFGCYTSENWKVHPRYYGGGESFVFQLYPEMRVYRWTRENNYFMFGTPDSIHIGGGSHFALSVSGDLLHGATGACETFGNGALVEPDEYGILHVELWGFQ